MAESGKLRLACTALGRRIMAGYPTKDGLQLKEPRHDVTSDALKAVVEKIGIGYSADVIVDGVKLCSIKIVPAHGSDVDPCPICDVPFKPDDICATDVDLGTCHAACLEGSPAASFETGEHLDGPLPTYRYDSLNPPLTDKASEAE